MQIETEDRQNEAVIGVLAHVDAGKTTLSERILYTAGAVRKLGRVDERTALLDHAEIERRRGITVFSDQAGFTWGERRFTLLDTPGHPDFSAEMERCLRVLDCALLVVSAAEGVQAHTLTLWELARRQNKPVIIFINKTDRAGADRKAVLDALKRMGAACVDFTGQLFPDGRMGESAAESLAAHSDCLIEAYCSSGYEPGLWLREAQSLLREARLCPVFSGSALRGEGIEELLWGLSWLAPACSGAQAEAFSGRVCRIRHDKSGRVVFIKVEKGTLRPKDIVKTIDESGEEQLEKCNELREYSSEKHALLTCALPGMLCGVTGLAKAQAGDRVGQNAARAEGAALRPILTASVLFDHGRIAPQEMLRCFRLLEDEEPLLGVTWNDRLSELSVQVMGEIQLEVLAELLCERFGYTVTFGACSVLYLETVAESSVGYGHFEPLRHYAEVHLRIAPASRGSGVTFQSACPLDALASSWQNLIRTHVLEKKHLGVLTGSPLTDVTITLLAGRAHLKHTEGGDFREATYRALRSGLMRAKSLLLEPYYAFQAEVEPAYIGRIQTDIRRMRGVCEPPEEVHGAMCLCGRAPVKEMMNYPRMFTAYTKGKGRLTLRFDGYEPCPEQQEVAEALGYEAERDVENSADSVFCSHGAGFLVHWREAPRLMHLPLEEI